MNAKLLALGKIPHRYQRLAYELDLTKPIACAYGPDALRMMESQWEVSCLTVARELSAADTALDRVSFAIACGVSEDTARRGYSAKPSAL